MTTVLVVGGYGGFGARISRRLADNGWTVLVAGRDAARAASFCASRAGLAPVTLDASDARALDQALTRHRPFAVVDAAGPFQGASYAVADACIARGIHYLDIADARDFVAGIATCDAAATQAGVAVISGASSVPALSGAVVRELTRGMSTVCAVEIAISASNRATAGVSVTRAILSYLGRPIRLWRGRRWITAHGWQDMRRESFRVANEAPLEGRLVALADVPDLELLPPRLPGQPAVTFRAGTELAVQNLALRVLALAVQWRIVASLTPLLPLILEAQRLTRQFGTDRSGMLVRCFGLANGKRIERRWTLIANAGCGPEIPALAVPVLLRKLRDGTLGDGARDAGTLLSLDDFAPSLAAMPVRCASIALDAPPSLYARVMGPAFDVLPARVRAMHETLRDHGATGRAAVSRGKSPLARIAAALIGFPPAGEHDVHVSFEERDGVETWTRDFSGHSFRSRLRLQGGRLVESFGVLRFGFDLVADGAGLTMHLKRWWCGPLPLPSALAPRSVAREWEADGRFHFDVPIALPMVGLVVHYRGWLT